MATLNTPDNNYAWWVGTDGNIWANVDGNVQKLAEGSLDYNGQGGSYILGVGGDPENRVSVPLYAKNKIDDPVNPSTATASASSSNSQLAQLNAQKAARTSEAQNIKSSMLSQRDRVSNMLQDILKNIESVYSEEKSKRDEQKDADSATLLEQLEQALPGIGSSFAAIGAYDSSWNNDAQGTTKEEHNKAQDEITKEYDADIKALGNKRNQARTDAQNAHDNFMVDFDTFNNTAANSDNLETLRASKNSLMKAINDFSSQGNYYKPGSSLQNEMAGIGNYDGQKAIDAFGSFLSTAGAGGSGVKAGNETTQSIAAKNKNKNEKTELEQNKALGIAK
jgi:hypothetical protein